MKGISQVDYVLAVGIFFVAVVFVINYTTDYIIPIRGTMESSNTRSRAIDVMNALDDDGSYFQLSSDAFRFKINVTNRAENLINQSTVPTNISDETVKFNISNLGTTTDKNSFAVYYNGTRIPCGIANDVGYFITDIGSGKSKQFDVYFDDDSSFENITNGAGGSNELNEKTTPVVSFRLIQQKRLESFNYTRMKETFGYEANIALVDANSNILNEYGPAKPRRGNVVSIDRPVIYQQEDAGIGSGKLIVTVW